jgi:hypothetical protein
MNYEMKKILPIASCLSAMMMTHSLLADDTTDTTTSSMPTTQITPPAGFAAAQGIGFSVYADFIYWEARTNNLSFVQSNVNYHNPDVTISSQGQTYYPSFSYMPGFKVGLAVDLGHDNWDLTADYTWLNGTGGKNSVEMSYTDSTLKETRPIFDPSVGRIVEADGNFGYHYNLINLDLGRNYFISQYLTLRPYFGLSGAWDKTSSVVHYNIQDAFADGTYVKQNYKQNFWGIGFSTGLDTAWCFDENWSIFADFSLMNLWSRFKATAKETDYAISSGALDNLGSVSYNTEGTQYGLQNVIDIQMGLRWNMRFNDDTMGFGFQIGWDQQIWINHVQQPFSTASSNLSIQGIDLRARFDF